MAKREISSTLRNLKFMQRNSKREDEAAAKAKVEEEDSFRNSIAPSKRCIVIMEGNPHPGALKGRMSFQSFNPSIDNLHEEVGSDNEMPQPNTNPQNGNSEREDGLSTDGPEDLNSAIPTNNSDVDSKRKQPETDVESPSPNKLQKINGVNGSGQSSSQSNSRGSRNKQQQREKLDWNLLRPPKPQHKRR